MGVFLFNIKIHSREKGIFFSLSACLSLAEPHSLVGSVENWRSLVRSPAWPIFFLRLDDSHYDRIHSSLTTVQCFDNGFMRKQPVAWKEIVQSTD